MSGRWWITQPLSWLVRSKRKQVEQGTGSVWSSMPKKFPINLEVQKDLLACANVKAKKIQ